jgi:ceramide glucosyltransferase
VIAALGIVCLVLALAGLAYLLFAIASTVGIARRPLPPAPNAAPSVTILKPLHGAEPGLLENLASFCRQHYGGPVQMICGVQNDADPAIAVVRELQAAFPGHEIQLVVDATQHGTNRKVSNLINMSRAARHELIVLADSDMRVGPDYLGHLAGALDRPGVGAVTCLYHGVPGGDSVWSQLSSLAIDSHFLASVAVGTGLGLAKPCFGSTIALRRDTLEAIGGFAIVADELADDYALGAAVRQRGLAVAIPPFTIGHVFNERSAAELARQELRWARTIRRIDPAGHAGSAMSHPLAFSILAAILLPGALSYGAVAAAILLRIGVCLAVEACFGIRRHPYWLVPARDLLSFGLFLASFAGRGVSWRGHSYGVTPGGVLIPKAEP